MTSPSAAVAEDIEHYAGSPAQRARSGELITLPSSRHRVTTDVPVLLTDASWYGTLAAVRDLGSRGVPVIVGYDEITAPARWSRFTRRAVPCPPTRDVDRFTEWLHDFGARNPGCVLYPTSDDVAFLIATHRSTLEPLFRLFSPPEQSLVAVLDKSRLARVAADAGLRAAQTWSPSTPQELTELLPMLPMPVLVKPRAQMLAAGSSKGVRVDRREDVLEVWNRMRSRQTAHPLALAADPEVGLPIIQPYLQLSETIYTIDGFAATDGTVVGALACGKALQLPRRSGAGVYFEHAPLDCDLVAGLEQLCRNTGFVGVFDVEFAIHGDEKLMIDFNPRFYNHMSFEIDRGLPLPWLAYLAATDQARAFPHELALARRNAAQASGVYVHDFPMRLMLHAQRRAGGMSRAECRQWRRLIARRNVLSDAAYSRQDALPGLFDVLQLLRHPRSLVRRAGS